MVKIKRKVTLKEKVVDTSEIKKINLKRWFLGVGLVFIAIVSALFYLSNNNDDKSSVANGASLERSLVVEENVNAGDSALFKGVPIESQSVIKPNAGIPETINSPSVKVLEESVNSSFGNEYIEQMALSVIRGNYGNNPERRIKLGPEYKTVQDKVNEMYLNGLVH